MMEILPGEVRRHLDCCTVYPGKDGHSWFLEYVPYTRGVGSASASSGQHTR
jgi:hypothetical protein